MFDQDFPLSNKYWNLTKTQLLCPQAPSATPTVFPNSINGNSNLPIAKVKQLSSYSSPLFLLHSTTKQPGSLFRSSTNPILEPSWCITFTPQSWSEPASLLASFIPVDSYNLLPCFFYRKCLSLNQLSERALQNSSWILSCVWPKL